MLRTSVNSFYGKRNFNKNIWERCCQSCGEIEKRGHGNLHRCKEAVPQRCSVKKVFSEISQNSQQNICTKVSFSLKKRLWRRCFPVNFMKFLRTPFLQNNSGRLVLDAFASEICQPVEPQNINLAQYQFDHLKNFDLANYNSKRLQMNIDLLIGSQDYWNFIGYKQVLGKSGLIAIFSRLGFVLSGPCANEQNDANTAVKFTNSYLLRVKPQIHNVKAKNELTSIFEKKITEPLSQSRKDAIELFDVTTIFQNVCYKVKLPFKEETDFNISGNFSVCRNRLENLLNNIFNNKDDLLTENYHQ